MNQPDGKRAFFMRPLVRELVVVTVVKLAVLLIIGSMFFGDDARVEVDSRMAAGHIVETTRADGTAPAPGARQTRPDRR